MRKKTPAASEAAKPRKAPVAAQDPAERERAIREAKAGALAHVEAAPAPNYGRGLALREEFAKRFQPNRGIGGYSREDYDTVAAHFDHKFYIQQRRMLAVSMMDLVAHYFRAGAREGLNPAPWFSSHAYLSRYPAVAERGINPFLHYLTEGRDAGCVAEPVEGAADVLERIGLDAAAALNSARGELDDVRERLRAGELGEQVRAAAEIEPLIGEGWMVDPTMSPLQSRLAVRRAGGFIRLCQEAEHRTARFVFLVNRVRWGNAGSRSNDLIIEVLADRFGPEEIAIIYTDERVGDTFPNVREGVRQLAFSDAAAGIELVARMKLFAATLRGLRPEYVLSINSMTLFRAMDFYGPVLSREMKILPYYLNVTRSIFGGERGLPNSEFYPHFHRFHRVLTDSRYLKDWFARSYLLPEALQERIVVMESPCLPHLAERRPASPPTGARPRVFWAGRGDEQKRIDVAFRIAAAMPEIEFHFYTDYEERQKDRDKPYAFIDPPQNAVLHKPFDSFDDVPFEDYAAYLYTSEWDGTPRIVIEMAVVGLPIVASATAGVPEVARPGLAWIVENLEDVDAYVAAIREIIADQPAARARADKLAAETLASRSMEVWRRKVLALIDDGDEEESRS